MALFKPPDLPDKRKHRRLRLPLECYVNRKSSISDRQSNISYGGVSFYSPKSFNIDDFIMIHFIGEQSSSIAGLKFSSVGKVVWSESEMDGKRKYGIQFKFYDDPFCRQQFTLLRSAIEQFENV